MQFNRIMSSLVLNWHFINLCNMNCRFCFAKKGDDKLYSDFKTLIYKCRYFKRINFVGGKPTIFPQFEEMVSYASSLGIETSVVTNGLFAIKNPHLFDMYFSKMSKVGLSIDSLSDKTNLYIGRCQGNRCLSQQQATEFCQRVRSHNTPLKINTVVTKVNLQEDFSDFIKMVQPNEWKIFQVLLVGSCKNYQDLLISPNEFHYFLKNHEEFASIIHTENNNMMINSYIMVDSDGFFMDTAPYIRKSNQRALFNLPTDVEVEFEKMSYQLNKYYKRYAG